MQTSSRRRFLARAAVVTGSVGVAGCLSDGSDGGDSPTDRSGANGGSQTDGGSDDGGSQTDGSGDGGSQTTTPESPRSVSFEAPHGATIEATAYGSGDCGVVLVPQINLDRESWRPQAEMIAEAGHLALAIDEDPDNRAASVRGAIRYLTEQRGTATLVLVGASTGGEAVVVANAETDATVDGTVTLSAAGGADRASDLQGRSLFVVGEEDEERFVRIARELHENAPEPTELVEYEGPAHGQGIFDSDHGDQLRDRLSTFVSEVCGN